LQQRLATFPVNAVFGIRIGTEVFDFTAWFVAG
jgi:hypothetical protein